MGRRTEQRRRRGTRWRVQEGTGPPASARGPRVSTVGGCWAGAWEGGRTEKLVKVVHARREREDDDVHDEQRDLCADLLLPHGREHI